MKRSLFAAMLLGLVIVVPVPTLAQVNITVTVPPPLVFATPPEVIVIPETYVYVVPDIEEDIFFYEGWWWRPWQGRWYRSRHYSSGWVHYRSVPSFYTRIPSGWRTDYREQRWRGHHWQHHRIPYQELHHNWRGWKKNRHWEKHNTWGVQGLKSHSKSREVHRSREGKPKHDKAVKSRKYREGKPQSHERDKSGKYREGKPRHDKAIKSQKHREGKPQFHETEPRFHEPKPHGKSE